MLGLNMAQIEQGVICEAFFELLSRCFRVLVAINLSLIVRRFRLDISIMGFALPRFILRLFGRRILRWVLLELFGFRVLNLLFLALLFLLFLHLFLHLLLLLLLVIIRKKLSLVSLLLLLSQYQAEVEDLLFHVFLFLLLFPPFFFRLPFIFQLLQHSFFFFL